MRSVKMLAAAAALAAFAAPAIAADMPVKAAPIPYTTGYPYAASGFYYGLGASATGQNASLANTGVVSIGAGLDGVIGFQWKGGLDFIALEGVFTYTNLGNSSACAVVGGVENCSLNSQFEVEPRVKFGFPLTTLTALLPNLSQYFPALPQLPASFVAANQHPYIFLGAPIRDVSSNFGLNSGKEWTVQAELGAGILSQWQSGIALDVSAGCTIGNAGFSLGPIPQRGALSTGCQTRMAVLY